MLSDTIKMPIHTLRVNYGTGLYCSVMLNGNPYNIEMWFTISIVLSTIEHMTICTIFYSYATFYAFGACRK